MVITLVITAEPDTATAARLVLVAALTKAFWMLRPTASTSWIFFSTTALPGSCSIAKVSTRIVADVESGPWDSSMSLIAVELMSIPAGPYSFDQTQALRISVGQTITRASYNTRVNFAATISKKTLF